MIDGVRMRFHVQSDSSQMRFRVHTIDPTGHHSRPNKPLEYENWPIPESELDAQNGTTIHIYISDLTYSDHRFHHYIIGPHPSRTLEARQ